jgi:hypothetical protein
MLVSKTSRSTPPMATAKPAADACTAPQAPKANPLCSFGAKFIEAVNVP